MTEELIHLAGIRHVQEVASTSRYMVERALAMRAESYMASVKAQLLTKTLYEIDDSRKKLRNVNQLLQSSIERINTQKQELKQQIDLRREVEQQLATAVGELQLVNDNIREIIVKLDMEGRLVWWNRQLETVSGFTAGQLRKRKWTEFVPSDDAPAIENMLRRITADRDLEIEIRLERTSADTLPAGPYRFNCRVVDDDTGSHMGIVASGLDISEQRQAERALESNEALMRLVLDRADEIFWLRDLDTGKFLFVSDGLRRVWGHPIGPFLDDPRSWADIVHPKDRQRIANRCQEHCTADPGEDEYRILRADGTIRWVWERWFPVLDSSGRVSTMVGIALDVTLRREAEEQRLAAAEKHKDTIVREIHHRIKNHLQGVTGLLYNRALGQPDLAPLIGDVIRQVESIAIVYGLQSRGPKPSLNHMVEEIANAIQRLNDSRIQLEIVKSDNAPVWLDTNWAVPVALIVNELLMNASKHQTQPPLDRPIEVRLSCDAQATELRITNAGRLSESTDGEGGRKAGSGLQLVRSLLPRQGADLDMRSEGDTVVTLLKLAPPVLVTRETEQDTDAHPHELG